MLWLLTAGVNIQPTLNAASSRAGVLGLPALQASKPPGQPQPPLCKQDSRLQAQQAGALCAVAAAGPGLAADAAPGQVPQPC